MDRTALARFNEEERAILAQFSPDDFRPAGFDNLMPGDTGLPARLVISQPNRPVEVPNVDTAGKIVNTLTGEVYQALELVVLMFMNRTRVKWPMDFSADNVPECISDNGETPTINEYRKVTHPMPGPCITCPDSQFCEDGGKPRCSLQRNFLVWLIDKSEPAILTLYSTGLKSAKQLTTIARQKGLLWAVMMTTTEVKEARGRWFIPSFSVGHKLQAVQIAEVVTAKNELQDLVAAAAIIRDDEEEQGGDTEPDSYDPDIPF